MLKSSDYYLPDAELINNADERFMVWTPDKSYIVLGASNNMQDALVLENVLVDNITVLKRPSGGQTVMLTPNNLIISVAFPDTSVQPKDVFSQVNKLIVSVLQKNGVDDLRLSGISDIAISERKILGSSIYRSKHLLLYHAVLNVAEPAETFERYLKHPTKEPDYRKGRKHGEFVTSLKENGFQKTSDQLKQNFAEVFKISLF